MGRVSPGAFVVVFFTATVATTAQEGGSKEAESAELRVAGRNPKALEILERVDAAIKKVNSVQYAATREGVGSLADRVMKTEGTVILAADSPQAPQKYRIECRCNLPGSDQSVHFTLGGDGELYYLIDPIKKAVYADIDPAVGGNRGQLARSLVMGEYLHPAPFTDELNADVTELVGTKEVGDEECYVIRVVYKGGQEESIWYFAKKDYLPRRREILRTNRDSNETGRVIHTLTKLVVAPMFYDSPYKLVTPSGYEKIGDFAPDIPLSRPR